METQQKLARKIHQAQNMGLRIAKRGEEGIDFSALAAQSQAEENVLPVSESVLEASFEQDMSAIFVAGNRAVGHVRFLPLIDQQLHADLGLSDSVPQIWEMGTGLMLPEYRGQGINIVLRHALVTRYQQDMAAGTVLAIATTKTPELRSLVDKMSHLFDNPSDRYPTDFRFANRENLPFIAPFTCVCTPDFGSGYQFGTECAQAEPVTQRTVDFRRGVELPIIGQQKQKLACTVFVSSTSLARHTDSQLAAQFNTQANLVRSLMERRYF